MDSMLYKADGSVMDIKPMNGKDFKLDELQCYVQGCIEIISLDDRRIMVVNEEGKFSMPFNAKATELAHMLCAIYPFDYISGDAVVCDDVMVK